MYSQLMSENKTENNAGKNSGLFNKCCWDNWIAMCRIKEQDPHLSHYANISSKWFNNLNLQQETMKLFQENIGSTLQDITTVKDL